MKLLVLSGHLNATQFQLSRVGMLLQSTGYHTTGLTFDDHFIAMVYLRDRPFNLKGGIWYFVSFIIFSLDNTRGRIFIFLSRKARIFFPEFNIRLYDKNSESDYFFFPPPKSEYLFQQHWESEYFFSF
jgi:hypothetical protein